LQEFMLHTKNIVYLLMAAGLIGLPLFWWFLTERDEDQRMPQTAMALDVLQHHDAVIHGHPDGERDACQRDDVDGAPRDGLHAFRGNSRNWRIPQVGRYLR
ncbi:MAG: hypothetical protein R6W31_14965, partial [Bacteroidales bacterium]